MFIFNERHVTVYHYNDTRSTVTRSSFDNDKRHVTAFRPISEAAHSWSYDKCISQMRPTATDRMVWSVCMLVASVSTAKQLNRLSCHSGWGLTPVGPRIFHYMGAWGTLASAGDPGAAAMHPCVKLLWLFVVIMLPLYDNKYCHFLKHINLF